MCRAQPYRVGHSPFDFGAFFIKVYGDVAVINGTGQRVLFCWPATDEAGGALDWLPVFWDSWVPPSMFRAEPSFIGGSLIDEAAWLSGMAYGEAVRRGTGERSASACRWFATPVAG